MPIESILEPLLPIIDPHHHLWDRTSAPPPPPEVAEHPFMAVLAFNPRYLFDELRADVTSGHNVRATVFVECGSMYNADAPERLRPVGETELAEARAELLTAAEMLTEIGMRVWLPVAEAALMHLTVAS